jgi:D-glycero-alpha-D-manno-heptose-7-phosphate kinase
MDMATAHGAAGCKVNGAGGQGGSLTILGSQDGDRRRGLQDALLGADPRVRLIPIRLSRRGLQVQRSAV